MAGLVDAAGRPLASGKPVFDILNASWHRWKHSPGTDWVDNPDDIPLSTYTKMQADETVFSGLELMQMMALSRLGDYCHEDEAIQDFINSQLEGIEGVFTSILGELMQSAFAYGFGIGEKLWKPGPEGVSLRGVQLLHPDTITLDIYTDGPDKNRLKSIRQFFRESYQAEIPVDKAILYTHRGQFGNFYGRSRLAAAYRWWYIKDKVLKSWAICAERYGTPYTYAKMREGAGNRQFNVSGQTLNGLEYMGKVLDSMGDTGSMVLTEDVESFEVKYAPASLGDCFEALVAFCNTMIYRALGLPALITDTGKTGSYSLAKQHFEALVLTLERILTEATDCVIEQLIRPLVTYNFGEQEDWGEFASAPLQTEDELAVSEVVSNLVASGVIDLARPDDINWARERLGLPPLDEEDLQPSLPEMPDPAAQDMPTQDSPMPTPPRSFSQAGRIARREALRRNRRRALAWTVASYTAGSGALRLPA